MEQEEYIVDGHKVTHSVHLGDREIFLAVQQDAPLPFYVGYMEVSYELGLARFSGIEGTTEYTEAWELFIQRLQKQIEQVRAQRQEHHAPQLLTEADCIRDSRAGDYEGKVLVMRPGVLRPEYWNAAHQLYFAVGGNGARAGSHGTKVFCINIYTGEHTYIRRTDVMGAIEPDHLPGWAKEKAAALRQDYQREKAAEKQRLEEFLTARREKEKGEALRRPRAAQTRGREKGGERGWSWKSKRCSRGNGGTHTGRARSLRARQAASDVCAETLAGMAGNFSPPGRTDMAGTKPVRSDRSSTGWSIPCGSPAACFPAEVKWRASATTTQTQALTETTAGNTDFGSTHSSTAICCAAMPIRATTISICSRI